MRESFRLDVGSEIVIGPNEITVTDMEVREKKLDDRSRVMGPHTAKAFLVSETEAGSLSKLTRDGRDFDSFGAWRHDRERKRKVEERRRREGLEVREGEEGKAGGMDGSR